MVQQRWSTEQRAMQAFKNHKMIRGSKKVENHWLRKIYLQLKTK